MTVPFPSVLVANRGEIACRIIRTLRSLGIRSIAVYSDADRRAAHVALADVAVRIGPADARSSYLNIDVILDAARRSGAQAIHPGYGFLSENAEFASACANAGIVFVGPAVHALTVMGDKIRAKQHVAARGVRVIPGIAEPGLDDAALIIAADEIGFPVLLKPSAGGGGKGMYAVTDRAGLPEAMRAARRVAASAFGDDTLFLERLVAAPRHIEVQVLADAHGRVIHLGERECSLQRRHQKVIEEAPSPLLDAEGRARMGEAACAVARSVDYVGAGTVEFLLSADAPDDFYFMEMNTRLQVEHPVTEMVTGLDLVAWQLRIAAGEYLTLAQDDISLNGHAIEARVYAEDAQRGFLPSTGRILALHEPAGPGIRMDGSLIPGLEITADYDPMLAKVIAHGANRDEALSRLERALTETIVLGVSTNVPYLLQLIADPDVRRGALDTGLIERTLAGMRFPEVNDRMLAAASLALHTDAWTSGDDAPWSRPTGWRMFDPRPVSYPFTLPDASVVDVLVTGAPDAAHIAIAGRDYAASFLDAPGGSQITLDDETTPVSVACDGDRVWIALRGVSAVLVHRDRAAALADRLAERAGEDDPVAPEVRSPMPGTVVAIAVASGDIVEAGTTLVTVEAMKMEHRLTAPVSGSVDLRVSEGAVVTAGQLVASVTPEEGGEHVP